MVLLRTNIRPLIFVALLCVGIWFVFDTRSDEDQIRDAIHRVADAAEAADIGGFMEPFSDQYSDRDGLDRSGIYGLLWQQFNRRGPISVWVSPINVYVDGETGSARFEVGIIEGNAETMIAWPIGAEGLHFEVDFVHEDGDWKIISHTRTSVTGPTDTGGFSD